MIRAALFPAALSMILVYGCTPPGTEGTITDTDTATDTPSNLHRDAQALIDDLIGNWIDDPGEDSTIFHEQWERIDSRNFEGLGFVMLQKDTVSIEHLNIHLTDTGTYYAAQMPSQNEGRPVYFKLMSSSDSLVFENPQHDFPQRIVYRPQETPGWYVQVSGAMHGEKRMIEFHLKPSEKGTRGN